MGLADLLPKSVQRAIGVDGESKAARALEQQLGIEDLGLQARFEVIRSAVEDNTIQEEDARGWINYRIGDDAADKKREISRAARPWGLRTQTSMQAYVPDPNERVGPTMHGDDSGLIEVQYQSSFGNGVTSPADSSDPSLSRRVDPQTDYTNGQDPQDNPFPAPEFPAIQGEKRAVDPQLILSDFFELKILDKQRVILNQRPTLEERGDQIYRRYLEERKTDPRNAFLKAQRELSLLERAVEKMSASGEIAPDFDGSYQFQNKEEIINLTLRQLAAEGDRRISYDAAVDRLERIGLTRETAYTILPRDETEEEGEPLEPISHLAENFDIIEKGGRSSEFGHLLGLSPGGNIESVGLNYSGAEWGNSDDPATGEFEVPNGADELLEADDGMFYTGEEVPLNVEDGIETEQDLPVRRAVDSDLMSKLGAALEEELPKKENRKAQRTRYADNPVTSTSHYFARALGEALEATKFPEAIKLPNGGGALLLDEEKDPFVESVLFSNEKDPRYVGILTYRAIAAYREESAQQRSQLGRRQKPSEFIANLDIIVEDVSYEANAQEPTSTTLPGFQPEITDDELGQNMDYMQDADTSDILNVEDSSEEIQGIAEADERRSERVEAALDYLFGDPTGQEPMQSASAEVAQETANDHTLEKRVTTQRARRSDFPFKRAAAGLVLLGALAAYHTGGPPESRVGDIPLITEATHEEALTPEPRATPNSTSEAQTPAEYAEAPVAEAQPNPAIEIQGDNAIIRVSLPEEFRRESRSAYDTLAAALATSPGITDPREDGAWASSMQRSYEGKDLAQVVGSHVLADNARLMVSVVDATAAYNGCEQGGLAARGCLLTKLNNGEEVRAVVPSQYVQLETQDASGSNDYQPTSELSESQEDGVASSYVHNANGEDFVVATAYQGSEADDLILEEEPQLYDEGEELFAEDFEGQATQVASIDELGLYNTGEQLDPQHSEIDDATYAPNDILADMLHAAYNS